MILLYALVDSREPEVFRYIGITRCRLQARLSGHLSRTRLGTERNGKKSAWIRSVLRAGADVLAVALREVQIEDVDRAEIEAIAEAIRGGHRLTNLSAGGGGCLRPPEEVRQRISDAKKGLKRSGAALESIRAAAARRDVSGPRNPRYGKPVSESTRGLIAAALRGRALSEDHRARLSVAGKGKNAGERNASAKLRAEDVVRIIERAARGERKADIAADYGIHPMTIYKYTSGKKWGHLKKAWG